MYDNFKCKGKFTNLEYHLQNVLTYPSQIPNSKLKSSHMLVAQTNHMNDLHIMCQLGDCKCGMFHITHVFTQRAMELHAMIYNDYMRLNDDPFWLNIP